MTASGLASRTVVVVGAGGLGCPALSALAEVGVGRLVVLDPDRVEASNLPRQILYRPDDVGREKAPVAAARVARDGVYVEGIPTRLDDTNEEAVLGGADVILDATDGALTKDWLNALAVRKGVALVHAAALRSEGRLLRVAPGGRPCLSCIFGRLEREGEACADHGVWGGVVGATGFLAAAAVLEALRGRGGEGAATYRVLDVGGGRSKSLRLQADPACPVCGEGAAREREAYPDVARCAPAPAPPPPGSAGEVLDLRAERCPMNLLRARRAVESLPIGGRLRIRLGPEGRESVPDGLRALGHGLFRSTPVGGGLDLVVTRHASSSRGPLSRDHLLRFSRQVVLPELGEEGQRRILEARVLLAGRGPAFETAATYLAAAGLGHLDLEGAEPGEGGALARRLDPVSVGAVGVGAGLPPDAIGRTEAAGGGIGRRRDGASAPAVFVAGALEGATGPVVLRALGALLADRLLREVSGVAAAPSSIGILPAGGFAP